MKKKGEIIDNFIRKMEYLTDERVLGVVKYEGYIPGYSYQKSDIWLYIINNDKNMFVIKNNVVVDDLKIEYYEKSLGDIYRLVDMSNANFISSLATFIGFGKIVYDRTGEIKTLQDYVIQKYSIFLSNDVDDVIVDIEKKIMIGFSSLQLLEKANSPFFSCNYYLLLEQIKQLYIRVHNLDDFTTLDAFMLSDSNKINQGNGDNFFTYYMQSIVCEGSALEKNEMLNQLYNIVLLSKERGSSALLIKEFCNKKFIF